MASGKYYFLSLLASCSSLFINTYSFFEITTLVYVKPDTPSGHKSAKRREQLMKEHGYNTETIYYNPDDPKFQPGSSTYIGPKQK